MNFRDTNSENTGGSEKDTDGGSPGEFVAKLTLKRTDLQYFMFIGAIRTKVDYCFVLDQGRGPDCIVICNHGCDKLEFRMNAEQLRLTSHNQTDRRKTTPDFWHSDFITQRNFGLSIILALVKWDH
ncbi:unnamed protein product [Calicophoron daubneyi]|uniref:Uncharacterized protein n=1 Tax=Calicophoron daubneyi TaxID=300641 RepID=A0AAV2T321_CALDB